MRKFSIFLLLVSLMCCLHISALAADEPTSSDIPCTHERVTVGEALPPTCSTTGKSGDITCMDCGKLISHGATISATGIHRFGEWTLSADGKKQSHVCLDCGRMESRAYIAPATQPAEPGAASQAMQWNWLWWAIPCAIAGTTAVLLLTKKKS